MKKAAAGASGVLALIAVSAIVSQTSDKKVVNVDENLVDSDLKNTAKDLIGGDQKSSEAVLSSLDSLGEYVKKNDKDINVDKDALMAGTYRYYNSSYDSTNLNAYSVVGGLPTTYNVRINCYRNCHRACHGSRGWR